MKARKICSRCGSIKAAAEFNKNRKTKDGLQPYCKVCSSEYSRERRTAKHHKPARRKVRATHVCVNVDRKLLIKARENFMTNLPKGLDVTDEQVVQTVLTQLCE